MGYKVIFSALVFVCSFYYATYAFRLGSSVKPKTGVAYFLLGVARVGAIIGDVVGNGFTVMTP